MYDMIFNKYMQMLGVTKNLKIWFKNIINWLLLIKYLKHLYRIDSLKN